MFEDYDSSIDKVIIRRDGSTKTSYNEDTQWINPRPLFDIRYDSYWLVERFRRRGETRFTYKFTGPVALPRSLLDMLPSMTEVERRAVQRYLPKDYTEAPFGVEVYSEYEEENDGA